MKIPSRSTAEGVIPPNLSNCASHQHQQQLRQLASSLYNFQKSCMVQTDPPNNLCSILHPDFFFLTKTKESITNYQ